MSTPNNDLKNVFAQKFNEFQLAGLQSYGRYLKQQQKLAKTHDNTDYTFIIVQFRLRTHCTIFM